MVGRDKSEDEHEDTSTIRELPKRYSAKSKSRSAKKIRYNKVHHRIVKPKKELTGKQLLNNLIRYLNYRIERREKMEHKKKA